MDALVKRTAMLMDADDVEVTVANVARWSRGTEADNFSDSRFSTFVRNVKAEVKALRQERTDMAGMR